MKIKRVFISGLLVLLLVGCGVVPSENYSFKQLESEPELGAVGNYNDGLLKDSFVESGKPEITEKIGLSVNEYEFNRYSLKAYHKKISRESDSLKIVDSIGLNPSYFILGIRDKIGYVDALNNEENSGLNQFLLNTNDNQVVTKIFIYFPPPVSRKVLNGVEVYMAKNHYGGYYIEVLDRDNNREKIYFKDGIAFGFQFSEICWVEDYRGDAKIGALKQGNEPCPGKTKRSPDKFNVDDAFDKI